MAILSLPAEGWTFEFLARSVRSVFLQPLLIAALFVVVQKDPSWTSNFLSYTTRNSIDPFRLKRGLKYLLIAGLIYRLNNLLTRLSLNNYTVDRSWDWREEIVVVTGGSGGIGELLVHSFAEKHIKVVLLDVVPPKRPLPHNVLFYQADITSSSEIKKTASLIRSDVGDPTVIVNNAGVASNKTILEDTEDNIRKTYDVNTIASILMAREFLPSMIKHNHGHIVTIASLSSYVTPASLVAYASSKAAVLAFHEGLNQELKWRYGAKKVRTTSVLPIYVRTPLMQRLMDRKTFGDFLLEPSTVADVVVEQVLKGESGQIIVPGRYSLLSLLRGFPNWLQEAGRSATKETLR